MMMREKNKQMLKEEETERQMPFKDAKEDGESQ